MKIPKNMSEEQVLSSIDAIVNRIAHKYTFYGYEVEDIKQEAFIICLDALNRYDEKRLAAATQRECRKPAETDKEGEKHDEPGASLIVHPVAERCNRPNHQRRRRHARPRRAASRLSPADKNSQRVPEQR